MAMSVHRFESARSRASHGIRRMTPLLSARGIVHDDELPSPHRRADIMAMPQVERRYTVAEVLQFPEDGNRYELIRGALIVSPAPTPRHQLVLGSLYRRLADYLDAVG